MNAGAVSTNRRNLLAALLLLLGMLAAQPAAAAATELRRDLARLQALTRELTGLEQEMNRLRETFGVEARGHFTAVEHSQIASLLFRYLACRESLWEMVQRYRTYDQLYADADDQARAFMLGFNAALQLAAYSSTLIATFMANATVVHKLNEAFPQFDIPKGTYNKIFASLTKVENLQALRAAAQLFRNELSDPRTALAQLRDSDGDWRPLIADATPLYAAADQHITSILEAHSLLLPEVRNRLRQTSIAALINDLHESLDGNLYTIRGLIFESISRLKTPGNALIRFTPSQVAALRQQLQPGDIILTFTGGYMSNVFLPGVFKHGITYVGSPGERAAAGLTTEELAALPEPLRARTADRLTVDRLPESHQADVVEAVAEGVIFNSLDYLLATHISRLVVLRPRLDRAQRIATLRTVFALLDNGYDFKFDFDSSDYLCCTEVIYRALQGRGPMQFELVERMGYATLSADDIIIQAYRAEVNPFDFVLLGEEDPDGVDRLAILRTGEAGQQRFRQLMQLP